MTYTVDCTRRNSFERNRLRSTWSEHYPAAMKAPVSCRNLEVTRRAGTLLRGNVNVGICCRVGSVAKPVGGKFQAATRALRSEDQVHRAAELVWD
jgi:hypothetical protein